MRVSISSRGELLTVLPHQLGHHLDQAVAVIELRDYDPEIGVISRADIPPDEFVDVVANRMVDGLTRCAVARAMVVGYEKHEGEAAPLRAAINFRLGEAGIYVADNLLVRGGRWWADCCLPRPHDHGRVAHIGGHVVPPESQVNAAIELIVSGSAPLADRDQLRSLVTPGVDAAAVGLALAALPAPVEAIERVPHLWARLCEPVEEYGIGPNRPEVTDHELASMARSLADRSWRDALIAWMSPILFPGEVMDTAAHAELVHHCSAGPVTNPVWSNTILMRLVPLLRRVPDEAGDDSAAMCTVAAAVAWGLGNGPFASDALDRALQVAPDYLLAAYLTKMVRYQLRPHARWRDVVA